MSYQSIEERLGAANVVLDNALTDPELLATLSPYGYPAERLQEGQALLEAAQQAQQAMQVAYAEKYAATKAFQAVYQELSAAYLRDVKIARVAVRGRRGLIQKLGLKGARQSSIVHRLAEARQFYEGALRGGEALEALGRFGFTEAKLQAGRDQVLAVENARALKIRKRGSAQVSTSRRNDAVKALAAWLSDFRVVVRVVFEGDQQQLEKLGVIIPS